MEASEGCNAYSTRHSGTARSYFAKVFASGLCIHLGTHSRCLTAFWIITGILRLLVENAADNLLGGMWAVVATVFVFRDSSDQSLSAGISRMIATCVSFALCLAYLLFLPFNPAGMAALIGIGTVCTMLLDRRNEIVTTGITTAVVMVVAALSPADAWRQPLLRLLDTGAIREAADSDLAPFAVVTTFQPEGSLELASVVSIDDLLRQLDKLRTSNNLFFAVRIDGRFDRMDTRAVCKKAGAGLVDAAASQAELEFHDTVRSIVGFWTPEYARTVNIAGWHVQFLSEDRSAGGHVLDAAGSILKAQVQHLDDFRMAIPESPEFLKADLTRDPGKALDKAERARER